jgi:hypothetical protein
MEWLLATPQRASLIQDHAVLAMTVHALSCSCIEDQCWLQNQLDELPSLVTELLKSQTRR